MASSDELKAQLEELMARLDEAKQVLAPIKDEQQKILSEKMILQEEFDKAFQNLKQRQREIDEKSWQVQKAVNQATWEMQKAQQELEAQQKAEAEAIKAAQEAAKEAEEHAILTQRFDKLTLTANWREWAKDHQIKAGHTITENRKVILADPMGLGKTLSSIIAVEMAERATKDASPEHPFLGEEKEFYVPGKWRYHDPSGDIKEYNWKPNSFNEDDPRWEYKPSGYETQIVNSVTRPVGRRVLYLCPSPLLRNVMDEWKMWAPHRNVTYIGKMSKAERDFLFEHVIPQLSDYVIVCNYEAWRREKALIDKMLACEFDTIIMDEAHNIKDRKSQAYKGVERLINEGKFEYIIPMTGTPILNRPQELFTLLHLVNPEEFYHENDFLFSYCEQAENDAGTVYWKFKPGGLERIAKQIRKNFLRRTKDQAGIDLPAKTIIHHDLDVDESAYALQAKARKEMRQFATIIVDESQGKALSAAAVIAMYTRLRQIETWPAGIVQKDKHGEITLQLDVHESQKIDYVINNNDGEWNGLIPEAIEEERMVLFSQFKAPLREIRDRCERMGVRAVILDGDTPDAIKEEIRRDFDARHTPDRANAKWDIVLCNYRVGGVGLNLTAATQLVVLDEEWNPGKRDQAYDRIHRIGQDKPVTIHVIRMNKTIDDWLAGIMEQKDDIVSGFDNAVTSVGAFKDALDSGLI